MEGHLRLTLHSSMSGLGPLHAVLSRRRGKVVTDTMVDGTDLIQVTATIPQAESFVSILMSWWNHKSAANFTSFLPLHTKRVWHQK